MAACSGERRMLFSTIGQGYIFLWMMGVGALIGAWYGLLHGLRCLLQAGFWLNLLIDSLFGAGAAGIFIVGMVMANYGSLRLYAVAAAIMGFALFAFGIWPPARAMANAAGRTVRRLFAGIGRLRWIKILFR